VNFNLAEAIQYVEDNLSLVALIVVALAFTTISLITKTRGSKKDSDNNNDNSGNINNVKDVKDSEVKISQNNYANPPDQEEDKLDE
jgi:hypothetical protein